MNNNPASDVTIRLATKKDAEELLAVYAPYVQQTAVTFELEIPSVKEFKKRITQTLKLFPYLVAETGGKIIGYAYASQFKTRAAYSRCAEISIYLKSGCKRSGIGTRLYSKLEELLKAQNILNVYAVITTNETEDEFLNFDSIHFHTKMGFTKVAEYKNCGFKFNRWYSVITMEKCLNAHSENPPPVIFWNSKKSF